MPTSSTACPARPNSPFPTFASSIPRTAPVSQPTTAYLSYDTNNLYAGWICQDDPNLIRSRAARRKDIVWDDRVTINIDTFGDRRHSYFFDVNDNGVQMDGTTTDGVGDDFSWKTLWCSEARITSSGYVVLETIPFKSIRFPGSSEQHWNVALARFIDRRNEISCWPYITRKRLPDWVSLSGRLEGIRDISPGRNIQVIPYAPGGTAPPGYDILFTWLLHPGTAVYAGYTDSYENYRFDPSNPPYLQHSAAPTLSTGRQAFFKVSYLFRF